MKEERKEGESRGRIEARKRMEIGKREKQEVVQPGVLAIW